MRIFTVRASTLRFFSVLAVCLIGLFVALFIGSPDSEETELAVSYGGIKTEEDRRAFIEAQGYQLAEGTVESVTFSVPKDFDRIISGYNEIQKKQGLDLGRYKGKRVTRYTYRVTNYEGYDGTVYANIVVYRRKIIACDISSADPSGFVLPLVKEL